MSTEHDFDTDAERELTRLRVEYWTKRLDHTLTHTQTSSRLIYLVDGAVLALLYFMIGQLDVSRSAILISAFPILVLAILNYLHSELVRVQQHWYRSIDQKLLQRLGETEITGLPKRRFRFTSTHGIYKLVHQVIAASLLILASIMFLYGIGNFQDIK